MTNRLLNFAIMIDSAIDQLWGGRLGQTISGTCGRAATKGAWWAVHIGVPIVDGIFGKGHCARVALEEAVKDAA